MAKKPTPVAIELDADEKIVFDSICASLRELGIVHASDSIMMTLTAVAYIQWVGLVVKLKDLVDVTTETPNGHEVMHPLVYAERRAREDLSKLLEKALMTPESFQRALARARESEAQQDLFDSNPLADFVKSRPAPPLRVVGK